MSEHSAENDAGYCGNCDCQTGCEGVDERRRNPYGPGFEWKWLECCGQQSIDGHLSTCHSTRVTPPGVTDE